MNLATPKSMVPSSERAPRAGLVGLGTAKAECSQNTWDLMPRKVKHWSTNTPISTARMTRCSAEKQLRHSMFQPISGPGGLWPCWTET